MPERPSRFAKRYIPLTVHCLSGTRYIEVRNYLSGSPWAKEFNKKAIWDLRCFLVKRDRYKNGARGADRHTWHDDHGLQAYGLVGTSHFVPWLVVPMSWHQLQMAFYGKGTPEDFRNALKIVDFYLHYADMSLNYLKWKYRMDLPEYAYYYFGMDCNGFTGAYLKTFHPEFGIGPNDHINYLDNKLKKRTSIDDVRSGDILSREGGSGTRHVAMVDSIWPSFGLTDGKLALITHSSGTYKGLDTQIHTLKHHPKSTLKWELAGYYKFNHCLALEAK